MISESDQLWYAIRKLGKFAEGDRAEIVSRASTLTLQKKSFLLKVGQTCSGVYFLVSGSIRQFALMENGSEHTMQLYIPHDWVLEHASFTTQQRSNTYLQATQASKLYFLPLIDLHRLIAISPRFLQLGKILQQVVRPTEMQDPSRSPESKYLSLLENRSELLQYFPLKYIASYLQMTPETLSRVRATLKS